MTTRRGSDICGQCKALPKGMTNGTCLLGKTVRLLPDKRIGIDGWKCMVKCITHDAFLLRKEQASNAD